MVLVATLICPTLQLDVEDVVHEYQEARRRLLVFGYNATLTTGVEQVPRQPKRQFDNLTVRCAAHAAVT